MSPWNFARAACILSICILPFLSSGSQPKPPQVLSFSPSGYTKSPGQVVATFSSPMVPIGDPRPKKDIFAIECPIPGKERWLDARTWVYEFPEPLPGGVECKFDLKSEVRTLKKEQITGETSFSFNTGGPSILDTEPNTYYSISWDQIFILRLDGTPDLSSIRKNVYFSEEGLESPIGIQIISGSDRQKILKSQYRADNPQTVLIQAKQRFAPNRKVNLVWGKGVQGEYGGKSETDQIFEFRVEEDLNFSIYCERAKSKADCTPILPVTLHFTAPIPWEFLERIRLSSGKETFSPEISEDSKHTNFASSVTFPGPFPESTELVLDLPQGLVDTNGRPLAAISANDKKIKTASNPPLAKFAADFGILESKADPAIPLTIRNIEIPVEGKQVSMQVNGTTRRTLDPIEIQKWFSLIGQHNGTKSILQDANVGEKKNFQIPKLEPKKATEVIGIPLDKPGFYMVEISSSAVAKYFLDDTKKLYITSSALVTNLGIHFKWGSESSLAWITSLDQGLPEAGVLVKALDCKGNLLGTGVTSKEGIVRFGKFPKNLPYCNYSDLGSEIMIFAQKGEDVSFSTTKWDRGMENWRYNLPYPKYNPDGATKAVVLDRTLLRAGETLHMKFYARLPTGKGLIAMDPNLYPKKVRITHLGSDESVTIPLVWSFPGSSEATYTLPKLSKLGTYDVSLLDKEDRGSGTLAEFRVEEFRLPVLKGSISLSGSKKDLVRPKSADFDLALQFLSGGGASGTPIVFRSRLSSRNFSEVPGFEDFSFNQEDVKPGLQFYGSDEDESESSELSSKYKETIKSILDAKGFASVSLNKIPQVSKDALLEVEMEYADPNGEIQTTYRSFPVYSSTIKVGLKPKGWVASKEKVEFQVVTLGTDKQPVPNQKVKVRAFSKKYFSYRKRMVGGFYSYEHSQEIKELGTFCSGKTNEKGLFFCEGKMDSSGEILFRAETEDKEGNESSSVYSLYVASSEESWFEATDHHRMDIIPEKRSVEVGETLKIQLRSPFREGTALVTIEREGVLYSSVHKVSGKEPILSIPIAKEFAPNVYLSAILVRGRIGDPKPTAMVDLAKPSFRMGLISMPVGWKPYQLNINVKPQETVYKVRDNVSVKIQASDSSGAIPKGPTDALVFVVDDALLQLSSNETTNLLQAMMETRGLDVQASTSSTQIIGRRHFGLKAKPTGGGGGKSPTRELFDTLIYWQGKVALDKDGKAEVRFPLKDSLSSFTIFAVVQSGIQEFGTGRATIRTSQDIQIFPSLSSFLRIGDLTEHIFVIRNTSIAPVTLNLNFKDPNGSNFPDKKITLAPSSSQSISWSETIGKEPRTRNLVLQATDELGKKLDSITISQRIDDAWKESTYQAGFFALEGELIQTIEAPLDAISGSSIFSIQTQSSLIQRNKEVETYFKNYPYQCLEQSISKAVGLGDQNLWKKIDSELGGYFDSYGLLKFFPKMERGSELLSAYILTTSYYSGWKLSKAHEEKTIAALEEYLKGSIPGNPWQFGSDRNLRHLVVLEALSLYRNVSLDQIKLYLQDLELYPDSSLIHLSNIIRRIPQVDPNTKKRIFSQLRNRINVQGTEIVFRENKEAWWLLGSADYQLSKLLLWASEEGTWKEEVPKIAMGLIRRQKRGNWDTTLGNAYATLALAKFSKTFEKDAVSGAPVIVEFSGKNLTLEPSQNQGTKIPIAQSEAVKYSYSGKGKPWVSWQAKSKIPLKEPIEAGYRLEKQVEILQRNQFGKLSYGDLVKVTLEFTADSDKTWVVLEDPIPAGSMHLGKGLGGESKILSSSIMQSGNIYPSFEERTGSHYRAFFEYLPQGKWKVEYLFRLGQPGKYRLGSSRIEAMYSPETFAEIPNETVEVLPAKP